jgi:nitrite reductase/ring-hydroxylating ferredoxin subunit
MSRADRRLLRYVDALLKDRPPRRSRAGDDVAAMRFAATLRAAHPGTHEPSPEFIDDLARRMRGSYEGAPSPRRRQFLAAGAAAAASLAAGAGIERLREAVTGPTSGAGPLTPEGGGRWTAVARVADVAPGLIVRFSSGGVTGFVYQLEGQFRAVSAVCTHQGCELSADAARGRLNCPCHDASFQLDGTPNPGDYRLNPLPTLHVRATGEDVEVLVAH